MVGSVAFERLLLPHACLTMTSEVLGQGQFGRVLQAQLRAPTQHPAWKRMGIRHPKRNKPPLVAVKTVRLASGGGASKSMGSAGPAAAAGTDMHAAGDDGLSSGASYSDLTQILLEARLMALLDHPNLVKLLAVCASNLPIFLVLELCAHGSLKTFLRARPPCVSRNYAAACLDIALQSARGVAYLHSKMCIHRDLAARNVLVDDLPAGGGATGALGCGYQLKLADLGLSRVLRTEEDYYRKRSDDAVPIKWQCPVSVSSRTYTAKSDVYSFGVLLWEIFSLGQPPFAQYTASEAFRAASKGERLPKPRSDTPAPAYALLLKCMTARPEQRPAMAVVVAQLEAMLGALGGEGHGSAAAAAATAGSGAASAGEAAISWNQMFAFSPAANGGNALDDEDESVL